MIDATVAIEVGWTRDGGTISRDGVGAEILIKPSDRRKRRLAGGRGGGIHNDRGTTVLRCTFDSNVPDAITYATSSTRPKPLTIDPNVSGDLDGDGDYDASDVRLAMIEFGIVEAMPGSPVDERAASRR